MNRANQNASLFLLAAVSVCGFVVIFPAITQAKGLKLDDQRIQAITGMLSQRPTGFGRGIDDRAAWEALAQNEAFRTVIPQAEEFLAEPIPNMSDEVFRESAITGDRKLWYAINSPRRKRIEPLVLAECLENKRRFVPAIEELIRKICSERTWVHPAHDRKLDNFDGRTIDIDLRAAILAWRLSTADYLLGDRLSPETRRLLRDNLYRRVFDPCREMAGGRRKMNGWMSTKTSNWVSVCLSGVTGSALSMIESPQERAWYVAAAEVILKNFFKGFTTDGYCSEGVGYWHYGFRHYLLLAEAIHQATGGKVDLLADPAARAPATYPARIEIIDGIYPTFSDCRMSATPGLRPMYFVSRRLGLGLRRWETKSPASPDDFLYSAMMYSFPNSASRTPIATIANKGPGIRSWFPDAGVLVARSAEGTSCRLAVAMKGGNNKELHNHNDVGSFVVVVGRRMLLVDPGAEIYTGRTFSPQRYESNVLNSYGHPVPIVAGQLQKAGHDARGEVVRTDFADNKDTLVLDMRSAYDVSDLEKLERTFSYSREGDGSLTVIDEVVFSSPKSFGTALITFDRWKRLDTGSLLIYDASEAVRVDITVRDSGSATGDFEIKAEQIQENLKTPSLPTRLGINLTRPLRKATIVMSITPTSHPDKQKSQ